MKKIDYFVDKSSIIDYPCQIGKNTKIWHFCHISNGAKIGNDSSLGQNVYVAGTAKIGNFVKIQNNVSVYDGVIIEDYVFCGPSMVFTNDPAPRAKYPLGKKNYLMTRVKAGASIGANVTIVCGNTIGKSAFIGAGAVVTNDIPDYALVYGNPARIHGWVCECGTKLTFSSDYSTCKKCGSKYQKKDEIVTKKIKHFYEAS